MSEATETEPLIQTLDEPMTRPRRYLVRMAVCVLLVLVGVALLGPTLTEAFLANVVINGMIAGVLVLGVAFIVRQVVVLAPEVSWIEAYRHGRQLSRSLGPTLLAPMATILNTASAEDERPRLSPPVLRSVLDGISARLDEQRDLARYLIGLLVFLGLLGTFWGLLGTISGVGQAIEELRVGDNADAAVMFEALKQGLDRPLDGMATAFSSSLFGLAGSLILGFLELQAAQAQARFYNELEEWLSTLTRLAGSTLGDGQAVPDYIAALLEQTADNLRRLEKTMARGEEGRQQSQQAMNPLIEGLAALTRRLERQDEQLTALGDAQKGLTVALAELSGSVARMSGAEDGVREGLRLLDQRLVRLLEEQALSRQEIAEALASEVRVLARTLGRSS